MFQLRTIFCHLHFPFLTISCTGIEEGNLGVLDSLFQEIIEICSVFPFVWAKNFYTQGYIKMWLS